MLNGKRYLVSHSLIAALLICCNPRFSFGQEQRLDTVLVRIHEVAALPATDTAAIISLMDYFYETEFTPDAFVKIDSLAACLHDTSPTLEALLKCAVLETMANTGQHEQSIDYGKKCLQEFRKYNTPIFKEAIYDVLAAMRVPFRNSPRLKEGFNFYADQLKVFGAENDCDALSICYYVLSGFYNTMGLTNNAIYNQKKSISYLDTSRIMGISSYWIGFELLGKLGLSNHLSIIGQRYMELGDYPKSMEYLHSALDVLMRCGVMGTQSSNLLYICTNIIETKLLMNEPDSIPFYLSISKSSRQYNRPIDERAYLEQVKARYFISRNETDSAEKLLQVVQRMIDEEHLPPFSVSGTLSPDYYLAIIHFRQERYAEAIRLIERDLEWIKNLRTFELRDLRLLAKVYDSSGDAEKSNSTLKRYITLQDSILKDQKKYAGIDFEIEQQINQSESAIRDLQTQKEAASLSRNYSIGIAVLLILISAVIYSRYRFKLKANRELQLAKDRAERSEKFKQQFLANMSHEIRTPMNAILGMTNLALESPSAEKQKEYLGGIQKSSDTLLHIINDILDVSKIEAGKIEIEQIDFSLKEVVEQVKRTLQHKADEKHIQLITSIDKAVPDVLVGDPVRLNQVLMNLCGNALKFTERGSVHLSVIAWSEATKQSPDFNVIATAIEESGKQSPTLSVKPGGLLRPAKSGARNDAALLFEVEDTGIGIPKEKLNSIFESFTQAHSSDSRRFGGTGLGLTISKQLIELMGGELKVESEPGSGSTFSFTLALPVGSEQNLESRKKSEEELDGSILNGLRILLADDNEYNRVVATDALKSKADVEIVEATNGRETIELLKQQDFDIVLMDVQMPELDGYQATEQIRNPKTQIRNHTVPIIALTASVIRSDLDKCKAVGMNDYVPKPFKASQLIHAIASVTGRSKSAQPPNPPKGELLPGAERRGSPYSESEGSADKISNLKLKTSNSIDLTYLRNFCDGDEARMKKYILMFLESIPPFTKKLEQAVTADDFAEIAKQVHAMKPKFVMMGMKEAYTLSIQVETDVQKSNQQHQFNPAMRRILLICCQAEKELSESLNTP
ncbi:MAG: response regulator [Chitinophagales bacterium]|nr:response regulator [Chitinophagales bacterium]